MVVDGKEVEVINPIAILSGEPLLNVGKQEIIKIAQKIAQETNPKEILGLLKTVMKGKEDDLIKMADDLVKITEPTQVQKYLLKRLLRRKEKEYTK